MGILYIYNIYIYTPSGKLTVHYGKSPCSMGKSTINHHFRYVSHYQRVYIMEFTIPPNQHVPHVPHRPQTLVEFPWLLMDQCQCLQDHTTVMPTEKRSVFNIYGYGMIWLTKMFSERTIKSYEIKPSSKN